MYDSVELETLGEYFGGCQEGLFTIRLGPTHDVPPLLQQRWHAVHWAPPGAWLAHGAPEADSREGGSRQPGA
ncbi:hypothetical protein [Streptomyces sp. NBC_00353]|uniref:hypothetical protein n=1 Tax=unclassified Streptomyces TaxID=2593676 RepID=UPI002E25BCB8